MRFFMGEDGGRGTSGERFFIEVHDSELLLLREAVQLSWGGFAGREYILMILFSKDRVVTEAEDSMFKDILRRISARYLAVTGIPEADEPYTVPAFGWRYRGFITDLDSEDRLRDFPDHPHPVRIRIDLVPMSDLPAGGVPFEVGEFGNGRFIR